MLGKCTRQSVIINSIHLSPHSHLFLFLSNYFSFSLSAIEQTKRKNFYFFSIFFFCLFLIFNQIFFKVRWVMMFCCCCCYYSRFLFLFGNVSIAIRSESVLAARRCTFFVVSNPCSPKANNNGAMISRSLSLCLCLCLSLSPSMLLLVFPGCSVHVCSSTIDRYN